ncbi:MAG: CvpA family protein [Pirellulales bacterium]|nr:CvpA family protein [Pirellulales bacterium]
MYVTLLMFVILFACLATLYADGLWSNAIRLINVVTAALLAMNYFEPLAAWLDAKQPTYTYYWDFLSLWGLFVIFSVIFRVLTDLLSRVKVRFLKIIDRIGSMILALWIGWVMVCFTMTSLHTAPLARNFMGKDNGFKPEERMVMGLAPDRQWLAFTQWTSRGPYARSVSEADRKREAKLFDPKGEFMPKYTTRRSGVAKQVKEFGTTRVQK